MLQDVRGRYGSEGEFVDMRPHKPVKSGPRDIDESTDAYDTIDWLVKNIPNNNGRVGMMGISYPGFYTAAGMIDSHPALKCASPQAPIADWFIGDDFHHNGAFYLADNFGFFSNFGQKLDDPTREQPKRFDFKTPDGYDFYLKLGPLANADKLYFKGKIEFWDDLMQHGTYDEFWQARNLRPHLKNIKAAVMTVGGWYDAEDLFGTLAIYRAVERNNPGTTNRARDGTVGARRLVGRRRRSSGQCQFLRQDGRVLSRTDRAAVSQALSQGRSASSTCPRPMSSRPARPNGGATTPGRRGTLASKRSISGPADVYRSNRPADDDIPYDEYVSDPAKPVPASSNIAIGSAATSTCSTISGLRRRAPTCWSIKRTSWMTT